MEVQNSMNAPFSDQQSFRSRLSSNRSIDRMSERLSNRSLDAKPSIIEILDIDYMRGRKSSSGRLSQVDEDFNSRNFRLSGNSCKSSFTKSLGVGTYGFITENYQMFDEIPDFIENQIQFSRHQCLCSSGNCSQEGCPCILAVNQLCVIGLCCEDCILKKNTSLTNDIGPFSLESKLKKHLPSKKKRQNNHIKSIKKVNRAKIQKEKYDFVYCTCKKTQCMKKYCPCFALNKQCNECCICDDCHNKSDEDESQQKQENKKIEAPMDRELNPVEKGTLVEEKMEIMIEEDIDNYFEESPENYDNVELHKVMDFEPVDFSEFKK